MVMRQLRASGIPSSVEEASIPMTMGLGYNRYPSRLLWILLPSCKHSRSESPDAHATREEVQALRASSSKLTKKIKNLERASGGNGSSDRGLVQMQKIMAQESIGYKT
jgi:hypothetical protein